MKVQNIMRDIKFRVWIEKDEEDGGEMCYDYAYEEYEPINDLLRNTPNLMQFTGLLDKNGKKIWEGDICQRIGPVKAKVVYNQDRFIVEWIGQPWFNDSLRAHADSTEVIGNIYENPELLNA